MHGAGRRETRWGAAEAALFAMRGEHASQRVRQLVRLWLRLRFNGRQDRHPFFNDVPIGAGRMPRGQADKPPLKALYCRQVEAVIFFYLTSQSFQLVLI